MTRIKPLDEGTVNRIAAGEVVERPASVLKELVENSLDAAARSVWVKIHGGGVGRIEVSDDGDGIAPEEMTIALSKHTTSKIESLEDISRIETYGFRGEALASIASVSRLTISSFPRGGEEGRSIKVEGGMVVEDKPFFGKGGTTVIVEDLFYNVPARKKFLKSRKVEEEHLRSTFWDLAIPCSEVEFSYDEEGRKVEVPPRDDFSERVVKREGGVGRKMVPFEGVSPYYILNGLISPPVDSYHSSRRIHTYVNRRAVREGVVIAAVRDALKGLIPTGRYPMAYLAIETSPEEVDFNVHPAKREARFRYRKELYELVRYTIRRNFVKREEPAPEKFVEGSAGDRRPGGVMGGNWPPHSEIGAEGYGVSSLFSGSLVQDELPGFFSKMKVAGQVLGNYALLDGGDELYFVDIHAAAERVSYWKILEERKKWLTQPETLLSRIDVSGERLMGYVKEVSGILSGAGYCVEVSGDGLAVTAVPSYLKGVDHLLVVDDAVEICSLDWGEGTGMAEDLLEELISRTACHSSLRGAKRVPPEEIEYLVNDLEKALYSDTCPHGRPTYIKITREQLNKLFKR